MKANVLWDSCSNLSFITSQRAKQLKLKGKTVKIKVRMIDDDVKVIFSEKFTIYIKDERGIKEEITVYGIEEISKSAGIIDIVEIATAMFPYIDNTRIQNPLKGDTDILIGMQYAAFHPIRIDNCDHLLLSENRFGYAISGSHPMIKNYPQNIVQHAIVLHTASSLDTLHTIESLGVSCTPLCGGCKCGKCHLGGKNMSIMEEKEGTLIESKLKFQADKGRFIAELPWIRHPSELPENFNYAYAMLLSTEKQLSKNEEHANLHNRQILDLLQRKAARKVTKEELHNYKGPKFFIAHSGVMKPDSDSTPYRVVSVSYTHLTLPTKA